MKAFELAERLRAARDRLRRVPSHVLRNQTIIEFLSDEAAELDAIANDLVRSTDVRCREVRAQAETAGQVVIDGKVITVETLFRKRTQAETPAL